MGSNANAVHREAWNKGQIVGQKAPFKIKDIWALGLEVDPISRTPHPSTLPIDAMPKPAAAPVVAQALSAEPRIRPLMASAPGTMRS
jgi:hypothetical protein